MQIPHPQLTIVSWDSLLERSCCFQKNLQKLNLSNISFNTKIYPKTLYYLCERDGDNVTTEEASSQRESLVRYGFLNPFKQEKPTNRMAVGTSSPDQYLTIGHGPFVIYCFTLQSKLLCGNIVPADQLQLCKFYIYKIESIIWNGVQYS